MADTKITSLQPPQVGYPVVPATDVLPIVVIADPGMATSGSTRKVTVNQILGSGGTATLASATITGDLTVRTNKLFVNATGVGVNYTSPAVALHVGTTGATNKFCINTAVTNAGDIQLRRGAFIGFSNAADNTNSEYLFANGGALEFGISGTTAMTLNSTGLGVGVSPLGKLHIRQSGAGIQEVGYFENNQAAAADVGARVSLLGTGSVAMATVESAWNGAASTDAYLSFRTRGSGAVVERLRIDSSGNVGIGVTPKSWASGYRALQIGVYSALTDAQGGATYLTNNAYFDSVDSRWEYITNNRVVRYDQDTADGGHKWYSAGSGAINAAITWGNPLMTLDASGNLILLSPSTPPTLATNGQLTVNATSNTNLRFSYRGSDGVTRVANLTLA